MKHSKRFEELRDRYNSGFCTREQLMTYVRLQVITPAEYEEITGESFTNS